MLSWTQIIVALAPFDQCHIIEKLLAVFYEISCWPNQRGFTCSNCLRDKGGWGELEWRTLLLSSVIGKKNWPHPSLNASVSLTKRPSINLSIQPNTTMRRMCCLCYLWSATTTIPTSLSPKQRKKTKHTCTRQKVEQIISLQIPEAISFQSIHSF